MLSLPHLVVLFVVALMVFGPEKLPELARMLGKATAEFRKMTSDFRYALEDEVRELERQTRIRNEEAAAAARTAAAPAPAELPTAPEGAVPRLNPGETIAGPQPSVSERSSESVGDPTSSKHDEAGASQTPTEPVSVPHEKSSDDNSAV